MLELKKVRCELGVTQKELAFASGLDVRWIQKLESGEINIENITVKKFFRLSKGLSSLEQKGHPIKDMEPIRNAGSMMQAILVSESR